MTCNASALPAEITAGLDLRVQLAVNGVQPGADLVIHLRGPQVIDLVAIAAPGGHELHVAASVTAGWTPGDYWYSVRGSSAFGQVCEFVKGQLAILPDLAAMTGPYDGRTQAERSLENIKAVLEKRATRDQSRYTINNRELWRMSVGELLKLRAHFAAEVRRQKGGGKFGRLVAVQFSPR